MSDQNNNAKKGWYMHTSYNEAQQLRARVKAEVAKHANDDNLSAILAGEATSGEDANAKVASKKKANRQLYGILVGQIAIEDLISYLSSNHDDKGVEALDYIMSCHGAGTDDNKLDAADEEYKDIERKGIPDGATIEEANAVLTKMTNLFNMLNNDNTYQMSVERHSRNMILVVKNRSKEHKQELRMQKDKFDATVLGNIPQVAAKLDGMAQNHPEKLNWRTSIVDLLKLLGLDSSLTARKELATELGCPADKMGDSAQMNMWLHKAVLNKLAENGGNVPADLLD